MLASALKCNMKKSVQVWYACMLVAHAKTELITINIDRIHANGRLAGFNWLLRWKH